MTDKTIKVLVILWLSPSNTDLLMKKFDEITTGMDNHWRVFVVKANLPQNFSSGPLPFHCSFQEVRVLGSRKSITSRLSYFVSCVLLGVKTVKKEKIDVITQHDGHLEYGMAAYFIARLTHRKCLIRVNEDTSIPLVHFLKSSDIFLFKSKIVSNLVVSVYRKVEQTFFRRVDWIITHGPMDYEKIKQITNNVSLVPLCIDTTKFKEIPKSETVIFREKLGISKGVKVILFVGRLHPEKGVDTLLKALSVIKNVDVLLLLIYSYSKYKEEYELLASKLGIPEKVRFIGYIPHDELVNYYNMADVYVLSSIREEWSNTIMEAMACGTPVVATEAGSNVYQMTNGKSGFLFPINDYVTLAKKIEFILINPNLVKLMTKTAKETVKKYGKNEIGDKYKSVIEDITS